MKTIAAILLCAAALLPAAPILLDEDASPQKPGDAPWLFLENALPAILRRHPDSVILFAGRGILRHRTEEEYIASLRQAAESCRSAKIRPILVALPRFGDIPESAAKQAAIRLKRLALEMHLEVIDLYSAQMREKIDPDFFFLHNGIRWEQFTPPAREWLLAHMLPQPAD